MELSKKLVNYSFIPIWILTITGLFILVIFCFFTYNYADDYIHKYIWEQGTFIDFYYFVKDYYLTHGGRALSPVILIAWILTGVLPVYLVTMIWLSVHFINCLLILMIINNSIHITRLDIISTLLLLLFSWVGMKTHIGYNVYWATGGYMTLSGFVGLVFIFSLKKFYSSSKIKKSILFLAFICGTLPENLSLAIGGLLTLFIIFYYIRSKEIKIDYIVYLLGFIIGFAITFFTPGTFQRMNDESIDFSFSNAFFNFIDLFGFYLFRNKVLLFFSIILGFFLKFNNFDMSRKILKLLFLFLILSVLVTIPFSFMPSMPFVKRAGYFFSFFISGAFIIIGWMIPLNLKDIGFNYRLFIINISIIICLVYIFYNLLTQFLLLQDIKNQMNYRELLLENSKGSGKSYLFLNPITLDEKLFTFRLLELSTDPNFNDNIRISKYYGLDSVSLK